MFINASNLDFLLNSENKLIGIKTSFGRLHGSYSEQMNVDGADLAKLANMQNISAKSYHRMSRAITRTRTQYVSQLFSTADYGVVLLRSNKRVYTSLTKAHSKSTIEYSLYDLINDGNESLVSNFYRAMTAKEFSALYANSDSDFRDSIKAKDLIKKAQVEIALGFKKYQVFSTWTKQLGLSAYNPKMMWLFANTNKIQKLVGVIKKIPTNRNCNEWNGIYFEEASNVRHHNCPKGWVLGENGICYPLTYAKRLDIKVLLVTNDSLCYTPSGRINSLNLLFSHKFGYFDGSKYRVYQHELHLKSGFVTNHAGESVPLASVRLINRLGVYYPRSQCVEVSTGIFDITRECVNTHDGWKHKSDPTVKECKLCGNINSITQFKHMVSDDTTSPMVCDSCHYHINDSLMRMCYSTDVLNHRGFGNTNMRINGQPVYVGLELETYADFNDDRDGTLLKTNMFSAGDQDYCVATRDGSLDDDHGVEYIFRPEGIVHQKRNVNDFCSKMGDLLAKDAGNGYGLHVHVSSHFLTEMDKVRIDNFVSIFEKYFRHVGARGSTEYQVKKEIRGLGSLKTMSDGKYKMVNIGRGGTIEYRFPKSLVDEVHINMNLELALATTMFCKYNLSNAKLNINKLTTVALSDFIKYVKENKKLYPLLNAENDANIKLNALDRYTTYKCVNVDKEVGETTSTFSENSDNVLNVCA